MCSTFYDQLNPISSHFTVAAAFGNVHGVYKPGNVKLKPSILGDSQVFVAKERGLAAKPINFVFHGGSGSSREEIREAIGNGAIKMNIDTDTQWASWDGILNYYKKNEPTCKASSATRKARTRRTKNTTTRAYGCGKWKNPCPPASKSPLTTSTAATSSKPPRPRENAACGLHSFFTKARIPVGRR